MKLGKLHNDGDPIEFDDRPAYEQRLMMLIGGVSGKYKTEYVGMERAMSIRLNAKSYPMVKALSNLSDNSMNTVINDLIEVAFGVMVENMKESDSDVLFEEQSKVMAEWMDEYQLKEKK